MSKHPPSATPAPRRKPHPTPSSSSGRLKPIWLRLALTLVAALVVVVALTALVRHWAPRANAPLERVDVLLVLGTSADDDGNPTPWMQARVDEAVREYERGRAAHILFTGGPAHNRFVEAKVMAASAVAEGVAPSAIVVEPRAQDTIENLCYSTRLLEQNHWHSVELISSPAHLPRAGLIFDRLAESRSLLWQSHAAPPLASGGPFDAPLSATVETLKTVRYLLWTRWTESCQP